MVATLAEKDDCSTVRNFKEATTTISESILDIEIVAL